MKALHKAASDASDAAISARNDLDWRKKGEDPEKAGALNKKAADGYQKAADKADKLGLDHLAKDLRKNLDYHQQYHQIHQKRYPQK